MSRSNAVPGFLPSRSGLHFPNGFPAGYSYPVVSLPLIGTVVSGQAMNGICGGFAFAALDLFLHSPRLAPPPDTGLPAQGSALYRYLTRRFVDSLGPSVFENAVKAIDWTQASSQDAVIQLTPSLAHRIVDQEWPAIEHDIDAGRPSPLFLIMGPHCGLGDIPAITRALGRSHQVLAYAYDLDDAGVVTLHVYDSNDPDDDDSTIAFGTGSTSRAVTFSAPQIEAHIADPAPIRGVFRAAYTRADPSAIGVAAPG